MINQYKSRIRRLILSNLNKRFPFLQIMLSLEVLFKTNHKLLQETNLKISQFSLRLYQMYSLSKWFNNMIRLISLFIRTYPNKSSFHRLSINSLQEIIFYLPNTSQSIKCLKELSNNSKRPYHRWTKANQSLSLHQTNIRRCNNNNWILLSLLSNTNQVNKRVFSIELNNHQKQAQSLILPRINILVIIDKIPIVVVS